MRLALLTLFLLATASTTSAASPSAEAILKSIHDRDRGRHLIWDLSIEMVDRSGSRRERTSKVYRRKLEDDRSEQVTVFLSPANIRHTALLDIEAADGEDYLWLYLPALKVTKRVPPADRGDKFVGTDFTMEDIDLGFAHRDYIGEILERGEEDGHPIAIMRIEPKTNALKRGLGFDYSIARVHTDRAFIVEQRFFKGEREIRRNSFSDIRSIEGVLTPMELRAEDLVNHHRTVLRLRKASYTETIPAAYFRKQSLSRELYQ